MIINEELIAKLAHLARLGLSPSEITKYAGELDEILTFFEKLQEVDTADVQPFSQITGLENVARADEQIKSGIEDELLDCSPQGVADRQIRVQKAI